MDIAGRVALVTGGASGIGCATVVALAQRGASIVLADRDEHGARQTITRVPHPDRVAFLACDVSDGGELAAAVDLAVERFGRLDILANVAGVGDGDLFADDPGAWQRVIEIDLTALIAATRLAVRAMRRGGNGGVIVNLASWQGLYPEAAAPVYSAAKAGVIGFTRSLAYLADEGGVRVNAICPELVDTPLGAAMGGKVLTEAAMAELRASHSVLTPDDVAGWVVRVIEDDSRAGALLQLTKAEGGTYV
jgi:NAD(P)-dependent dehydrogenase (short-subunit alcohol dehydrogenase family)